MRVLLQDKKTGLFLVPEGSWTGSRAEARDFRTSISAIRRAQEYDVLEAVVVFAFGSPSNDVSVRLHEERPAGVPRVARANGNGGHRPHVRRGRADGNLKGSIRLVD